MYYHFIVNPNSRSGKGASLWEQVKAWLSEKNIPFDAHLTDGPGDAIKLSSTIEKDCSDASSDTDAVIAVGGDGTLNEVINGLSLENPIPLGYLPAGSGNDFARSMSLPNDMTREMDHLLLGASLQKLDLGLLDMDDVSRRFAVSSGIGYDAAVCQAVGKSKAKTFFNRIHLGKLVYLWLGVQEIFRIKPTNGTLRIREEEGGKWTEYPIRNLAFLSAHNQPYEGGGYAFAPKASPSDGKLDLCVVTADKPLKFLPILLSSMRKAHLEKPGVYYYQCAEAELTLDRSLPSHTDGEVLGLRKTMHWRCLPSCLPFVH